MLLDRLVIGDSVESIVYAFLTDSYFIPTLTFGPIFYKQVDQMFLGSKRQDFSWSRMQMLLALSGKMLNYKNITSIKTQDNKVKISTKEGTYKYYFGLCLIFDTTKVQLENEILKLLPKTYTVYDDFKISNLGKKHNYIEPKNTEDVLASKIHFYTSSRVDGANYVTDCVCESILNKEQINDFNYSDSMTRFAVKRYLDSVGIKGTFMNFYKNGNPKFRKPSVTHLKRIVVEKERSLYKDSDNVKFMNLNMGQIFNDCSPQR